MTHDEQLAELRNELNKDSRVVAGWNNGVSGKSAMLSEVRNLGDVSFSVVTHPVVIEGTTTPICWVSWTYQNDDPEGYNKAMSVCIEQAEWIAKRINKNN